MAHLTRKEYFGLKRAWKTEEEKDFPKGRLFNKTATRTNKAEVTKYNGDDNIELLFEFTWNELEEAFIDLQLTTDGPSQFSAIRKTLTGTARPVWDDIVSKHYATGTEKKPEVVLKARDRLVQKLLNDEQPQDANWRYMRSGRCNKPVLVTPEHHERRWNQWIVNTKKLPSGAIQPSEREIVEQYFLSYCKNHQLEYVTNNNKIDATTTVSEITEQMSLYHTRDLNNGTIDNHLRNKAIGDSKKAAKKQRNSQRYAKHQRDDDRSNSSRPTKRSSERKFSSSRDRDDKAGKKFCPIHKWCTHTWDTCNQNPDKKQPFKFKKKDKRDEAFVAEEADDDDDVDDEEADDAAEDESEEGSDGEVDEEVPVETYHMEAEEAEESAEAESAQAKKEKREKRRTNKQAAKALEKLAVGFDASSEDEE